MRYCSKCGAQLSDEAKFCQQCGFSQVGAPVQKEITVVNKGTNVGGVIATVFLIALLLGGVYFALTVEFINCPACGDNPWVRWACWYCGGDGKVTILQRIQLGNG